MATAVLLGSMVPGAQAVAGVQDVDTELAYTCGLPEGEHAVKVHVTAKVPESAEAGQVIQPEDLGLDLTLPEGASAVLADSGAATVSAEAQLSVDVAQGISTPGPSGSGRPPSRRRSPRRATWR